MHKVHITPNETYYVKQSQGGFAVFDYDRNRVAECKGYHDAIVVANRLDAAYDLAWCEANCLGG